MKLTNVDAARSRQHGMKPGLTALAAAGCLAIAGQGMNAVFAQSRPQVERSIACRADTRPQATGAQATVDKAPKQTPGRPHAQTAVSGLQQYLDTLKNPASTQEEVGRALAFVETNDEAIAGDATGLNQTISALSDRIGMYPPTTADSLSLKNRDYSVDRLLFLMCSSDRLPDSTFNRALGTVTPYLTGNNATAVTIMFARKGTIVQKELCDGVVSRLLSCFSSGDARRAIAQVCYNRGGDLATYDTIIQQYKQTMNLLYYAKGNCYGDGNLYKILACRPASLTRSEYEGFLEHFALNVDSTTFQNGRNGWLGLLEMDTALVTGSPLIDRLYQAYVGEQNPNKRQVLEWCMLSWCFENPLLFGRSQFSALFNLDMAVGTAMKAQTPNRIVTDRCEDYWRACVLIQRNRGEPVLKTLFEQNNITYFSYYPLDVLEHAYYDRERVSQKPIMLMVFTKWPMTAGGVFSDLFNRFDYTKFDIRAIEPRSSYRMDGNTLIAPRPAEDSSTVSMISLMMGISNRLNKKFRHLVVNGHGCPDYIMLKSAAVANLNRSDTAGLRQVKPLFVDGFDIILNACSTAGGDSTNNLAKTAAQTMEARCFGADNVAGGISSISFNTRLDIETVGFFLAGTRVYDYRKVIPTAVATPSVTRSGAGYAIAALASENVSGTIFDLRGRVVGRFRPDASNILRWNASNTAAGQYIMRIRLDDRTTTLKLDNAR